MDKKMLNFLGIAVRAGKVQAGFNRCSTAIKSGKAKLVIVCCDISEKTVKEIRFLCDKYHTKMIEVDCQIAELTAAIGTKAGICAVCDLGFANNLEALSKCNERID